MRSGVRSGWWCGGLVAVALLAGAQVARATGDDLPRRGAIGLAIETREGAAVVTQLRPGGPAASAGVRTGDVLVAIGGRGVVTSDDLSAALRAGGGGEPVAVEIRRGEQQLTLGVTLDPTPRETVEGSVVEYGSVTTGGGYRLRTIVTTPIDSARAVDGRAPAFMFVQGIYCASLDRPQVPQAVDTRLVHAMADAGFVTLRVDKAGLGDSEGPACSDIGFHEELDGYRAALVALAERPDVDPSRIYIFGHSMGGVMAPYLAQEVPLAGSIVFGTLARTWFEYQLENTRRQMELSGFGPDIVTLAVQAEARSSSMILVEKKTLGDVWERYPELRNPGPMASETHLASRHMRFYHELQDLNLAEAWTRASGAVLAIHGEYDWVTSFDDHERIASIIDAQRPGDGTALSLPRMDHAFTLHGTLEESMLAMGQGEWDGSLPAVVLEWISAREDNSAEVGGVSGG